MKNLLNLAASVLFVASFAFAHGNEQHIMGTVSRVTDSNITITTADGKGVDVALTPQTTFTKEGKTIKVKEIKQGDRIVVHASKKGDKLEAEHVQIGVAKSMDQTNMHEMKGMDMGADKSQQPH